MILDPNHVPYCDCGSVNKAGNCIGVWWYCDASIYRAGSTDPTGRAVSPAEYCGFGIIPCVDHLSLVHASHGTMKEQVSLSMDIVIHGLKPQYLDWARLWSIASLKGPLSHNITDTNGFLAAGHCSQYETWHTCVYDQCQLLVGCSWCLNALIIWWSTSLGHKIKGCLAGIRPKCNQSV